MFFAPLLAAALLYPAVTQSWDKPPGLRIEAFKPVKARGPIAGNTWSRGFRTIVWTYESPLSKSVVAQIVGSQLDVTGDNADTFTKVGLAANPSVRLDVGLGEISYPADSLGHHRTTTSMRVTASPVAGKSPSETWPLFARKNVLTRVPSWLMNASPESVSVEANSAVGSYTANVFFRLKSHTESSQEAWVQVFGKGFPPVAGTRLDVFRNGEAGRDFDALVVKFPVFEEDIDKGAYFGP